MDWKEELAELKSLEGENMRVSVINDAGGYYGLEFKDERCYRKTLWFTGGDEDDLFGGSFMVRDETPVDREANNRLMAAFVEAWKEDGEPILDYEYDVYKGKPRNLTLLALCEYRKTHPGGWMVTVKDGADWKKAEHFSLREFLDCNCDRYTMRAVALSQLMFRYNEAVEDRVCEEITDEDRQYVHFASGTCGELYLAVWQLRGC